MMPWAPCSSLSSSCGLVALGEEDYIHDIRPDFDLNVPKLRIVLYLLVQARAFWLVIVKMKAVMLVTLNAQVNLDIKSHQQAETAVRPWAQKLDL